MINAYSVNQTVDAGGFVNWDNVKVVKGCAPVLVATAPINLNAKGVYQVECSGYGAAGVSIQLYQNGLPLPETLREGPTPAFTTLVQVANNNTQCCCTAPTTLQVGCDAESVFDSINITVTKIV